MPRRLAEKPLVSVVIPCWDQAHYLGESVESVLSQTYERVEAIVVDDGSSDNTGFVVARYPTVRYRRQPNRGAAAARNAGLEASEGDLLVFLDADDRLLEDAIDTGVAALRANPNAEIAVGACRDIDSAGRPLGVPSQPLIHRDHYLALLKSCFVLSGSSVLFTRRCLEAVDGFDEALRTGDDYDLYLRLARRFPLACHGRVVTEYRRHAFSLTADPASTLRGELGALRGQRRELHGRPERVAFRAGRRRARRTHGEALERRLYEEARRGRWREATRCARVLLRNRPHGLVGALRDLRRTRGPLERLG